MPKSWVVHPLTRGVLAGGGHQREFRVTDPDRPGKVFTLRVSERDGNVVFDRLLDEGGSIEVEFEDVVEAVAENKVPPAR